MEVQSAAGYNLLDVWGLFATYGWPPDITSAVDKDRRRRIHKLLGSRQTTSHPPDPGHGHL